MTIPIRLKNDSGDHSVTVCLVQVANPKNCVHREALGPGESTKVHVYPGVAMCVEEAVDADAHHPPRPHDEPMLEYFQCAHFPPRMKAVANPFRLLAESLVHGSTWAETGTNVFGPELRPGPARTAVLQKLRDAKDMALHAAGNQVMIEEFGQPRSEVPTE